MNFEIGSKVVYPSYGVVEICGVESKIISGHAMDFYDLCMVHSDIKLLVPISSSHKLLREVMSDDMADEIFQILEQPGALMHTVWARRQRIFQERISKFDLRALALILRDLWAMKAQRQLPMSEQYLYDKVLFMLTDEVSVAWDVSFDEVESKIIQTLMKGLMILPTCADVSAN